jgi:hypothetical protein
MASNGAKSMTKVEKLELAIDALPREEFSQLRQWFLDRDWEAWDREIEADAESGKLDFLRLEAAEAKKNNRLRDV